ncbi:DUF4397 domain-containing protein [Flavobacterium selenitireducens]|uniref:DUF4397 domain-containing protein n=1 Tax=Flavobacterium selenitireducens TaxID=2722704 RepID=UPI00168A8FDE|nr:DUF4397 domain-containing protein [Flavobacterium selenitireducens]MBD3583668.1 DUF4397 domain-containing protein [Flavobacterium selenitireducens]
MKSSFIWKMIFGITALLAVSSCNVDDEGYYLQDTAAHGIIGNASPNSGDLYFFADANQVNSNALNFGSALGYFNFYEGNRTISVKNATGEVLASTEVALSIGEFFTVFAVNTSENLELAVYEDTLINPAQGKARIRFINLAPDSEGIDVFDSTVEVASDLIFKEASSFTDLPAGNYEFAFKRTSDGTQLATKTIQLNPGRIYTIYTKGFVTPAAGNNDAFSAEAIYNY